MLSIKSLVLLRGQQAVEGHRSGSGGTSAAAQLPKTKLKDAESDARPRAEQQGPLGAASKAKARDAEAEEKQKPRPPLPMAAAALKSRSADHETDLTHALQADPAQLPPVSLGTENQGIDELELQPAPSATEVLVRELEELTLLAAAKSKVSRERRLHVDLVLSNSCLLSVIYVQAAFTATRTSLSGLCRQQRKRSESAELRSRLWEVQ